MGKTPNTLIDTDSTERSPMTCPTGIYLDLDPLDAYETLTNGQILNAMGVLPHILSGMYKLHDTFKENADFGYVQTSGFKPFWSYMLSAPTAIVQDNGLYKYPKDPDRNPLAVLRNDNESCFIYESGFIAVRGEKGNWITARLD